MRAESLKFLTEIEETPSPSGFEQAVQRVVRKRMKAHADRITTDVHGNTICSLNLKGKPSVMLAGHCDQIGLMANYIDDKGFIFVRSIGGVDNAVLPGTRVTVVTKKGHVNGIIGRRPIHVLKPDERNAKMELRDMWIDIGAKDKKEAEKLVSLGDPAVFRLGMEQLENDMIVSPGLDNKTGTFVVMETLRILKGMKSSCAVHAVSTVQEEIGCRGAITSCFGLEPDVGIAVDVTHATDYPDIDKRTHGDVQIGKGPVIGIGANINPVLSDLLIDTAKKKKIAYQISAEPSVTPTDAQALQVSRAGVATALVSIPNRYMHTQVETVSLKDLESCAKLFAETISRITPKTSFIPK